MCLATLPFSLLWSIEHRANEGWIEKHWYVLMTLKLVIGSRGSFNVAYKYTAGHQHYTSAARPNDKWLCLFFHAQTTHGRLRHGLELRMNPCPLHDLL